MNTQTETMIQDLKAISESLGSRIAIYRENRSDSEKVIIIRQNVLQHFGETWEKVNTTSRKQELVICRQMICYFAKKYTAMPLKAIGRVFAGNSKDIFKGKDHSTVIHAIESIDNRMYGDKNFRLQVEALEKKINYELS